MASVLKLKTDIKKLKAAIASKATSGAIKTKLRGKLTSLENELDKLQPNKRKPKTTGPKNEAALVKLAKKRRTNQGLSTSKIDIERDAIRPAKKAGKRISASGNTYYEYRDNRVDNRQPPKKYRKLADGGMVNDDYRKKLENHIYETALSKEVNGFKLVKLSWDKNGVLEWTNKQRPELEIYATPFYTPDHDINFEVFVDGRGKVRKDQEYELSGDLDKDTESYFNYLEAFTKKYAKGKMADGGKTQGYDDKKDESLGMTRGKLSLKDFVGNRKQKEHSRRDDARFEERGMMDHGGYMAKGGKTKDQEVVRGYFEDEAYEYGQGGNVRFNNVSIHISKNTEEDMRNAGFTFDPKGNAPLYYNGKEVGYLSNFNGVMLNDEYVDELVPMFNTFRDAGIWNYRGWKEEAEARKRHYGNKMADGGSVAKGNYEMLMSQAKEIMHHAEELMQVAKPNMDVEAWVVSKAERATTDLSDITHYLDGLKMAMGGMVKHNTHKVNG